MITPEEVKAFVCSYYKIADLDWDRSKSVV